MKSSGTSSSFFVSENNSDFKPLVMCESNDNELVTSQI